MITCREVGLGIYGYLFIHIQRLCCSHMNRSPCTSSAEGDAPQITSKENRPEARYASNPAGAFVDPKPRLPGRDPVRARGGYGLPRVSLTAPRASRFAALQQEEQTKNEEEEELGLRRKDKNW